MGSIYTMDKFTRIKIKVNTEWEDCNGKVAIISMKDSLKKINTMDLEEGFGKMGSIILECFRMASNMGKVNMSMKMAELIKESLIMMFLCLEN